MLLFTLYGFSFFLLDATLSEKRMTRFVAYKKLFLTNLHQYSFSYNN